MRSHNLEVPWLQSALPGESITQSKEAPLNENIRLETPDIQLRGNWQPEEFRTANHNLGRVAIFGHCFADEATLHSTLAYALENNNPESLTKLPGSYTTLLFRPDGLTALADLANQFPLFYDTADGNFRFASLAAPLCNNQQTASLDKLTLAARIGTPWASELLAGRSYFDHIQRLEAGHMLQVNKSGKIRTSTYENFISPSSHSPEDTVDALREALINAARSRVALGRFMSSDFSGGLDSTSLAYLVARETENPLLIATAHAPEAPTDDLERVHRYLKLPQSEGIFAWKEFIHSASEMMYANLLDVPAGDEPDVSIRDRAFRAGYYQFLMQEGSELHITGNGADSLFDADPRTYLGELAQRHKYPTYLRSILEVARAERDSPLRVLSDVRKAAQITPATALQAMAYALSQTDKSDRINDKSLIFGCATAPEWLTTSMQTELADLALDLGHTLDFNQNFGTGNYAAYADIRSLGSALHGSMQMAARFGMREHNPYMDNDVLRACLAIQTHQRVNPWVFKNMLGRALVGIVPPPVTARNTKGDYTPHAFQGLRSSAPIFNYLLQDSRLADLGIIEPTRVRASLEKAYRGANMPWVSFDGFVASELWLRKLDGKEWPNAVPRGRSIKATSTSETAKPKNLKIEASLPNYMQYGLSANVVMRLRTTGAIAIDISQGTYLRFNKDTARIIQAVHTTNNLSDAIVKVQESYPTIDKNDLYAKINDCVKDLLEQGILTEGASSSTILENDTTDVQPRPSTMTRSNIDKEDIHLKDYASAIGGFAITLMLQRLPFARQMSALSIIRKRLGRNISNEEQARRTLTASRHISEIYPGRVACLELAMTTVMATALQGKKIDLVIGAKTDPDSFHAWPEVDGVPVLTSRDEAVTGVYQHLIKI